MWLPTSIIAGCFIFVYPLVRLYSFSVLQSYNCVFARLYSCVALQLCRCTVGYVDLYGDGQRMARQRNPKSVRPGRPRLLLQCPMSAYQGAPPNGVIKERQLKRGRRTQGTKSMKTGKQQKRDRKEMEILQ